MTTTNISWGATRGELSRVGSSVYPPNNATAYSANPVEVSKWYSGGVYSLAVSLIMFDTSSLPAGEEIVGATLTLTIASGSSKNQDGRAVDAEYYPYSSVGMGDYTANVAQDFSGTFVTNGSSAVLNALSLSGINPSGNTCFRLAINGDTPVNINYLSILSATLSVVTQLPGSLGALSALSALILP